MATLPAFLRKNEAPVDCAPRAASAHRSAPARDPFALRALPHEDVFFFCKKIDNSRLVRAENPRAQGACWWAIGAACVALALATGVLAPSVGGTLAGYKLEALRAEERRLVNERRVVELQEAELLRPDRLEKLAKEQHLMAPAPGQVIHLDGKGDSAAVAMVK